MQPAFCGLWLLSQENVSVSQELCEGKALSIDPSPEMPSGFLAAVLVWDPASVYTSYQNVRTSSFSLHKICEAQQWKITAKYQMHTVMLKEKKNLDFLTVL